MELTRTSGQSAYIRRGEWRGGGSRGDIAAGPDVDRGQESRPAFRVRERGGGRGGEVLDGGEERGHDVMDLRVDAGLGTR